LWTSSMKTATLKPVLVKQPTRDSLLGDLR